MNANVSSMKGKNRTSPPSHVLDLPVVEVSRSYHIGDLDVCDGLAQIREYTVHAHYELGLLSISQDPESWRQNWAEDGWIVELEGSPLRLLAMDDLTAATRVGLERIAMERRFLRGAPNALLATDEAYEQLKITSKHVPSSDARTMGQVAWEIGIAALLEAATALHGIWWCDNWNGAMRTERGGLFLSQARSLRARIVARPQPTPVPASELASISFR